MNNQREEIIQKLTERDGMYCSSCGKLLDTEHIAIEHIIPKTYGGTDELHNLLLVCPKCNALLGSKPALTLQFKEYIEDLLQQHSSYSNIRSNIKTEDSMLDADLIFERTTNNKTDTIIAEISVDVSYTSDRIANIIELLNNYKNRCPFAKIAFIFPGELSQKYMRTFKSEGIEVWDRQYLESTFRNQIISKKTILSKMFFYTTDDGSFSTLTKDKYLEKIEELKGCPRGKAHWGHYQRLVGEIIEMLFSPELEIPVSQSKDQYHRNRRDYTIANYATSNIWSFLRERYCAEFIVVDAKNSEKAITKQDVLQIENYLKQDN